MKVEICVSQSGFFIVQSIAFPGDVFVWVCRMSKRNHLRFSEFKLPESERILKYFVNNFFQCHQNANFQMKIISYQPTALIPEMIDLTRRQVTADYSRLEFSKNDDRMKRLPAWTDFLSPSNWNKY